MFNPKTLKLDWLEDNPLAGGHRFVFTQGQGPGRGGAPTEDGTVDDQNQPNQPETRDGDAAAQQRRNQEYIRQLDQLVGRDAISAETHAQAIDALRGHDRYRQSAARLLATRRINGDLFDLSYECLEDGTNSEKALARSLLTNRINQDVFRDALSDLDGGDQYESRLARRLAMRRIDGEEYARARIGLQDPDIDISRASQMLALGSLTPQQFRAQMNMAERQRTEAEVRVEEDESPINAQQRRTHDQIVELLLQANVLIETLPERERTRPLLRLRNNLEAINNSDRRNRTALSGLLRQVNEEEEHLSEEDVGLIWNFTANTKEELREFKEYLEQLDLTSSQRKNILRLKKEEWNIETRFLNENRVFNDILQAVDNIICHENRRRQMVEEASKTTGIDLQAGTQIEYVQPFSPQGNIRTVTISEVEPVISPILNRDGTVMGSYPTSLRIHLDSGESYSLGRFIKWVDATDVYQVIADQNQLEQALNLSPLGMTLQAGQNLEFDTGYHVDGQGNIIPERETVRLVSISDNGVQLERPVTTLTPEQAPHVGLTSPRMCREMNLGEFAKWARRNDAMPDVPNLQALREHLGSMSNFRNQVMSRNPAAYPAVRVEPEEVVRFGDDDRTRLQIRDANDDEVTFADGTTMTLPSFLVWARNNGVESAMPEVEGERAADAASNLDDTPREVARKKGMGKAVADMFKSIKKDDDGKTLFEKMSPYIPKKNNPYGYFQEVYAQTTFLSLMDLYNMGKEIVEFIKRKHQRRSKMRYGGVGKKLPSYLGTEMNRITQSAENEEVNQYKEAMDMWGTWEVLAKLHSTGSKDEAKACFITLTEKGELRWDDMDMWNALNRLTSKFTFRGAHLFIPLTHEPQPHPDTGVPTSGEDRTKDAIDELWGEGNWADWFSKNINAYNSNKSAYEYKGKMLEHDPKGTEGLSGELTRLLNLWKAGNYVNPHEFEELIDFGIKYGKMSAEQKLFFLMEGITARCPSGPMKGMTLLHLDRIGELDGVYLNQFPMLDFFTNKNPKPLHPDYTSGDVDEPPQGGYKVEDFEQFRDQYFKEESERGEADKDFSRFLWEWMIVDPNFKKRLTKGLRRAENMDHDDAHMFIPPASMEEIEKFTGSQTGNQLFFTLEGYKNGYAGYNQYIVSLSNRYEDLLDMRDNQGLRVDDENLRTVEEQMLGALQGYFSFDSYLDGRRDQTNDRRARLDRAHYNDECVIDPNTGFTVGDHKAQLDNLIQDVCRAYNIDMEEYLLYSRAERSERQLQGDIANQVDKFLKIVLREAFQQDQGAQVFEIVARKKNAAIGGNNRENPNALRGIATSNRLLP